MTSKERMKKAMDLEEPDRVPVMCQMSVGHMLLQTGFSPSEFWHSGELFAEGLVKLRAVYEFDGILISLHGHPPQWRKNIRRVESLENQEVIHWKNGDRTIFPGDDLPLHYPFQAASPPSISEFDPETIPEDIGYIPVSQGLYFPINRAHAYDIFEIVIRNAGKKFSIHGEVTSPFDYFLHLLSPKQALMALIEEPSKARDILQRFTEGVKKIAEGQAGCGVDAIKISSPFAGSGFISSKFYREFVLPYERQIAEAIRSSGVHAYTHTCGSIADRLEMMVEAGISGIECLDPPPLGNVQLEEAKRRIGSRVFIKGNIDPVHTLLEGTEELVREDARKRLKIGKPAGGFILSTACSIAPHTRRENIQALSRAAREEGSYQ